MNDDNFLEAVSRFGAARCPVALTGAGISVACGIPDFRSPGGLWEEFAPSEYATISVFRKDPAKAWQLYRAMGKILVDKQPSEAHLALGRLEEHGLLSGVVTQNVDNLHQLGGSSRVFEIHGDHQHLQCLRCGRLEAVSEDHFSSGEVPECEQCACPLKPNVVLFGEDVRHLAEIQALIEQCDLLMVIGTSAQVYPAASLPQIVKDRGGVIYEFNQEQTPLSMVSASRVVLTDYFLDGDVEVTLPLFVRQLLET
ncbi:MAG: NAD-dependent deacylase [Thermodesulfobacteriota bacterium]